ncbi:MAG TPA: hypothetical protein VK444_02400 [Methanobacteriaceae archaeon]|nr:hypothetical protein [Methanobacteriaceae archaeon]
MTNPHMAMDLEKMIIYCGVVLLLVMGIYNVLTGLASEGLLWILISVFFFAIYKQAGKPLKSVKARKLIVMIGAFVLIALGVYSLYQGQILSAAAWGIAGILGLIISSMLKGFEDFNPT